MVKAVIFDVDGTLIDSVDGHAEAWLRAFRHFGIETSFEAVRSQIGKGGDQLLPLFMSDEDVERRGEKIETWRADLFQREYLPTLKPFPDVPALFERIRHDGKRNALASSAKRDQLGDFERIAGIEHLVDVRTCSDDADRSKPHPDIFASCLEKLGLSAGEAVVVGDSPYDAEAAGKLGLRTIGVLCGGFAEADLREAGASEIARDPTDLLRRYEDILGRG